MSRKFPFAERFHAPQGEGLFAGTQMAFARLVGCSVGQSVCTACDTDFTKVHEDLGGGMFTAEEIVAWSYPCQHLCITGGEPLDRDISELVRLVALQRDMMAHVETSGTKSPAWLDQLTDGERDNLWLTVSPKPGFTEGMIERADEVKVILGGLGDGPGWPSLADAIRWADAGKLVYVQPRNHRLKVDHDTLKEALAVVAEHPQLRLSVQLHKFLETR